MLNAEARPRISRRALIGGGFVVALAMFCAWAGWAALQPDLSAFVLPGAEDIRYAPVGPGMQSVAFSYLGEVEPQTYRLYSRLQQRGWLTDQPLRREDCGGVCLLGQFTLVFTRRTLFDRVLEVATVEQTGVGPFHVRVVLRRCIQLPRLSCWPPG